MLNELQNHSVYKARLVISNVGIIQQKGVLEGYAIFALCNIMYYIIRNILKIFCITKHNDSTYL